jgi:hypothetical protein
MQVILRVSFGTLLVSCLLTAPNSLKLVTSGTLSYRAPQVSVTSLPSYFMVPSEWFTQVLSVTYGLLSVTLWAPPVSSSWSLTILLCYCLVFLCYRSLTLWATRDPLYAACGSLLMVISVLLCDFSYS